MRDFFEIVAGRLFGLLFPKRAELMGRLFKDVVDLSEIAKRQMKYIRELEEKVDRLEGEVEWLKDYAGAVEEELHDAQFQLQNKEEF